MKEAIGIIETNGFVAAIGALDGMLKAANVKLIGYKKKLGASLVTITISGDVGAVNAAIETGRRVGEEIGEVVATHIIPRVSKNVTQIFEFHPEKVTQGGIAKMSVSAPVTDLIAQQTKEQQTVTKKPTPTKTKKKSPAITKKQPKQPEDLS